MSMELELVLVRNNGRGFQSDALYVEDTLKFEQDYKLFAQIDNKWMKERGVRQVCEPHPIPPGFKVMVLDEEKGWEPRAETNYDQKLTYVTAGDIAKIKPSFKSDWNSAILAMMKALPADFPVILWWR